VSLFVDAAPRRPGKPATRRRIAQAAAELFASRGYAATSLQAVADAAGVHVQSIFMTYGTKIAVLEAAVRAVVAGDDDFEGFGRDWPWAKELLAEPDPERQLRLFAHHIRNLAPRAGPLTAEMRSAARADAGVEAFLTDVLTSSFRGPSGICTRLAATGALRAGLSPERAADMLQAVASYEMHDVLVHRQGWSPDEYEAWVGDLMCTLVLE
jgi:AcrR family transcriptional regulator